MSIAVEDLNVITKSINKEIKKAVELIISAKEREEAVNKDYFKETEKLLYKYPLLKLKISQDEEFLYDPDAMTAPAQKSKDIIKYSGSGHGLDLEEYTQSIKRSMMRTRQEVLRIERALEVIREDKYYEIIPLKYFDEEAIESIAEHFDCDVTTIRRNKSKLVKKIMVIIFGSDSIK